MLSSSCCGLLSLRDEISVDLLAQITCSVFLLSEPDYDFCLVNDLLTWKQHMGSKLNKRISFQLMLIKEKHFDCFSQPALILTLPSSKPSFEEVIVVRKMYFTFEQKYKFIE